LKEVNFKDRVPTYPGRVTLTPVEDSVNTFTMERADEPLETGTPLDKATFNSIIHSRLTGRYYPLTAASVLFDTNVSTVSPIPKASWILDGNTRAVSGGYEISASSVSVSDYSVEKATDGKEDTSWSSADGTAHNYTIKLPIALEVRKIKIKVGYTGSSYFFQTIIQGSTNGEDWDNLLTLPDVPTEVKEYTLATTGDYQYYRVNITRGGSSRAYIFVLEFSEYANNTQINVFTNDEMPAVWETGQIVYVQLPEMQMQDVIANIFNGVRCTTVLQSNKRYELRYNGTSFDAKEM
jgi:hypothetical protein